VDDNATHAFMLAEAKDKRLFAAPEKARKFLQKNPEEVKKLTAYRTPNDSWL
jgi:hypothetical protein